MMKLRIDQYFSLLCLILAGIVFPFSAFPSATVQATQQSKHINLPPSPEMMLPVTKEQPSLELSLTALSAIVLDIQSGTILFQKDIDRPLPIASLTKLMTALIAIEQYNLDDTVVITTEHLAEGNTIKLQAGETITIENLLKGLLIFSGNDAAQALANHHPQGYHGFIQDMNVKAQTLGLSQTSFENPAGLDNVQQYSTARDLALLMREVMKQPHLATIMNTQMTQITSNDQKYTHMLYNTNQLLGKLDGLKAGKTGSTPLAAECLITQVDRDQARIITVLLGSTDRFAETTALVNWTFEQYDWKNIAYNNTNSLSLIE